MFDVPAQVFVEFGLELGKLLLGFAHVLLKLQTRLPCVVVPACESTAVTHLVSYTHTHTISMIYFKCSDEQLRTVAV